ncbi:MAG: hypothetical protein H8E98_01375 [Bacteroidetes bacterium]|nr:hypothetical protein [Bacteroidota bacterium]
MTFIAGLNNIDNEIYLCADNRISFKKDKQITHQDNLQKIYFPLKNIVVAFTSNDLSEFKDFIGSMFSEIKTHFDKHKFSTFKKHSHIHRKIKSEIINLKSYAELLVGVIGGCGNKLYYYSSNGKCDKIKRGNYKYCGSAISEGGDLFNKNVVKNSFKDGSYNLDLVNQWMNSNFTLFDKNDTFKTIGNAIHCVGSKNKQFCAYSTETTIIFKNISTGYLISFDSNSKTFVQKNLTTNDEISLVSILNADFSTISKNNVTFQ